MLLAFLHVDNESSDDRYNKKHQHNDDDNTTCTEVSSGLNTLKNTVILLGDSANADNGVSVFGAVETNDLGAGLIEFVNDYLRVWGFKSRNQRALSGSFEDHLGDLLIVVERSDFGEIFTSSHVEGHG